MANQHVNKVVYGSSTLIDLTSDTITAENVIEGYTFHGADGSTVEGTLTHLTDAEIDEITGGGGGGSITVSPLSVSANGTYTAPSGTAYSPVTVAVPTFDALSWLGEGAELVATYDKESTLLSSTSYNGWTPSTTAKTIKSGATAGTYAVDMEEYDYLIRWQFFCEPVYGSDATNKARFIKTAQEIYQAVIRRPGSLAYIGSLTDSSNACQTVNTPSLMNYYNASGSNTYTWAASYGIYASATAATFASSTALSTTLTVKRPAISARCSTTYFSTGNASAVTQASTYFYTKGWLYRVKKSKSLAYNQYHNVCSIFNDGL